LQNALLAHDKLLKNVPRGGLVHRIDKDTSGLLVVARTLEAHTALTEALAAHEVEREYLAVCTGVMTGGGTVDEPIGRHRTQRIKMAVRSDGREAVTHYRVEKKFRAHTLARVRLETGRTHQIRVHFSDHGHPLIGDRTYGRPPREARLRGVARALGRQALHAHVLGITHPATGKKMRWSTPPPADMQAALAALRS
jgi:23S rRNA pseudouridine1911/1915/1917 synthase